ncbi:MAG: IS21 family transposase [Patescibacteria group bacterium]
MGYKEITVMDIYEIIRRWHDQQKIAHIANALGYDRKTVRHYIKLAQQLGLSLQQPLPDKEQLIHLLNQSIAPPQRPQQAQQLLERFLPEITDLVNAKFNPVKPKIAFEVICEKYDLSDKVSYSSFKNFVRNHQIAISADQATCRLEVEPGSEAQLDYATVGLLFDPLTGHNKTVHGFITNLSFSRHKFVEFTFTQNQQSFVASHVNMFEFFGGVPHRLLLDNLKNGVIKPSLYDPQLNRTYQELAEHYGCFIDPCRVSHPKDKGKVERDVQTVRQQFRKLLLIHPSLTLAQANQLIQQWAIDDYGQKDHGTTHWKPYPTFCELERPQLKLLPLQPFDMSQWKQAKVHSDHYVQFNNKAYSVPHRFVGKTVWVRGTHNMVQIYHQHQLIKQHAIAKGFRQTDVNDFPPNFQAVLDKGLPRLLQQKANQIGPQFGTLIRSLLEQHAFLNMRRAQGLVALAEKYSPPLVEQAAELALKQQLSTHPKLFKRLIEIIQNHNQQQRPVQLSQESLEFVRDMDYFSHEN